MIRLSKSVVGEDEINAVNRVLQTEFLGMGEEVHEFEKELSEFFGVNTVCVNSGTAAIQLALQAAGIKRGDEVLVQSLTFLASFQAISATGAIPIPCEINEDSFTIDIKDAESKITDKTKAIVPVHYASNVGDLTAIYDFASKFNLRVIEDAAHAFGTIYQDKLIGSFGDIICFSFDGIKNITSGEGGAIVSNDRTVIERVMNLRLLGVVNDSENRYANKRSWDFNVNEQGWRFHMSNVMAAIGRVQLNRFPVFKIKRQTLAKRYMKRLEGIDALKYFNFNFDNVVPHIFVVRILDNQRDRIKEVLNDGGIQTGIHYKPNHLLDFYKSECLLPKTEKCYSEILTLPLHPDLSITDIDFICDTLINNLKKY
jgi:dTDP-4-amino-4,6-dideoxygalactose transaminase